MRPRPIALALSTLLFVGCGGGEEPDFDGGPGMDGGTLDDGGSREDGAAGGDDAGASTEGCAGALLRCGDGCVDVSIDATQCGGCGLSCAAGESCVAGVCGGSASCPPETVDCGGECRDVSADPEYCGACGGGACADDEVCADGGCRCRPGLTDCGGACVDTGSDPAHCGGCGAACDGVCTDGVCGGPDACPGEVCGGACVDTERDPANCGGCGRTCARDQVCLFGACEDYEPAPGCRTCGGCTSCPSDAFCCEIDGYGASCLDLGVECPAAPPSV